MTEKQELLLEQIKEKSLHHDWNIAFNGKSKGNHHLERVQKIAQFLHGREGGSEFVVLASAWVHDVSLSSGNDNKPQIIREATLKFLNNFDIDNETKNKIADATAGHEGDMTALTVEAKIVHDADAIDKAGMLGVIRHTWKMTNLIKDRRLFTEEDLHELQNHLVNRQHHIYTKTGKEIADELNKVLPSFFNSPASIGFMKNVSTLAIDGVISDDIAQKLVELNAPFSKDISAQLHCDYLHS